MQSQLKVIKDREQTITAVLNVRIQDRPTIGARDQRRDSPIGGQRKGAWNGKRQSSELSKRHREGGGKAVGRYWQDTPSRCSINRWRCPPSVTSQPFKMSMASMVDGNTIAQSMANAQMLTGMPAEQQAFIMQVVDDQAFTTTVDGLAAVQHIQVTQRPDVAVCSRERRNAWRQHGVGRLDGSAASAILCIS